MRREKVSLWGLLVAGIIVISVVTTLIHRGNPLPYYWGSDGGEGLNPSASQSSDESQANMVQYANEHPPFTVDVPGNWTKVIKSGYITWIDRTSASSFQIQIGEYTPVITEVTQASVGEEITAFGGELVQFYWIDEWNYACMYRTFTDTKSVANIEITAFNQENIVRFVFMVNEEYYSELENIIAQIIDSFVWDRFAQ